MASHRVGAATTDDAREIAELARRSWHAAYDDILGAETVESIVDDWYAVEALRETIADDAHVFLTARAEGTVRGFAHAGPDRDDGHPTLFRLYVEPDHWSEGIGTDLLEAVEDALRERDVSTYRLTVLAKNDVGVSFYESRGFERVGTSAVELGGVETTEYAYRKRL